MTNKTIILNKEDVNNPLHPNLWGSWLQTMGIEPNATEVCLEVSSLDENKRILTDKEKIEKVQDYLKEKKKLFGNSEDDRGRAIIEVLQNIEFCLR